MLSKEKCVVVGSGSAVHVSLLLALKRPELVCGIIGLNAELNVNSNEFIEILQGDGALPIHCPVRLTCSLGDSVAQSLQLAEYIASEDVVVEVSKCDLDLPYAAIKQCLSRDAVPV